MTRIKREPHLHDDARTGSAQSPMTIDEGHDEVGAAHEWEGKSDMALETINQREARLERERVWGLGGRGREDGMGVKSEDEEDDEDTEMDGRVEEGINRERGGCMEVSHETTGAYGLPNPTGPLYYGPTSSMAAASKTAERRAHKEERKRARNVTRDLWAGAKRTQEELRDRLPNASERAAFDSAILHRMEELKSSEEPRGRGKNKRKWSRRYRALEMVRDLPLFRAACNTAVDRSSHVRDLAFARPAARFKQPRSRAFERRRFDEDTSSILAEATNDLAIDDDDEDGIAPEMIVPSCLTHRTFEGNQTESGVLVKSELSMDDSANTDHLRRLRQEHASIWEQHKSVMRRHFQGKGFHPPVYNTKVAIQKKGFQGQAANEIQVEEARRITEQHLASGTRTCITDFGGTAFDTEFPSEGLWELSSTKLWQYYQNGNSWDQLGWIPGGYLRIRQLRVPHKNEHTFQAEVVVEFGASTYVADQVTMPLFANSQPLVFLAHHQDCVGKQEAIVNLRFFHGGHIQLVFPAANLIKTDEGCDPRRPYEKFVEFAGVLMGAAD